MYGQEVNIKVELQDDGDEEVDVDGLGDVEARKETENQADGPLSPNEEVSDVEPEEEASENDGGRLVIDEGGFAIDEEA